MTEDTTRKASLQKAALGRTTAGVTAREQADLNMGSVSPPIPFVLLTPPGPGTHKGFVAVFLAGLLAENFVK